MDEPQKIVYFSDAIFLGGAEEYLKLLIPEIDRERYQARVVLCDRPATRPLAKFFQQLKHSGGLCRDARPDAAA